MVSTPAKLIAVAAGVVQFDKNGLATVKIVNLDLKPKLLNKNQHIAFVLPMSFTF